MGLTVQTAIVPGQPVAMVQSYVEQIPLESREKWLLAMDKICWSQQQNDVVFSIDTCAAGAAFPEILSRAAKGIVLYIYVYDSEYWGYYLYDSGNQVDEFCSDSTNPEAGDAGLLAKYFSVRSDTIERYIGEWDGEAAKAYPEDEYTFEDDWQFLDFIKKLGYTWPGKQKQTIKTAPMPKKQYRSIEIKKPLIETMCKHFPAYTYNQSYKEARNHYAFSRKLDDNLYEHILFIKDFAACIGVGYLRLVSVACAYHANWKLPQGLLGEVHNLKMPIRVSGQHRSEGCCQLYQMQDTSHLPEALDALMDEMRILEQRTLQGMRQKVSCKSSWKALANFLSDVVSQMPPEDANHLAQWLKAGASPPAPKIFTEWIDSATQLPELGQKKSTDRLGKQIIAWTANHLDINIF